MGDEGLGLTYMSLVWGTDSISTAHFRRSGAATLSIGPTALQP